MSLPSPSSQEAVNFTSLSERIAESETRVADVTHKLEALKSDVEGLSKRKGRDYLQVAGTVIAILVGSVALKNSFHKAPHTIITKPSDEARLIYHPADQELKVGFSITLQNVGNRDDAIVNIFGRVSDLADKDRYTPLSDFNCAVNNTPIGSRFAVPKDGGSVLGTCTVTAKLGSLSRKGLLAPGLKELSVSLERDGAPNLNVAVCFLMDEAAVEEIARTNGAAVTRKFHYVDCMAKE